MSTPYDNFFLEEILISPLATNSSYQAFISSIWTIVPSLNFVVPTWFWYIPARKNLLIAVEPSCNLQNLSISVIRL